ncbi:hypothetical protein SY83_07380 [Paenibacillus swuensis]|uniref:ABC transporter permease n=1 Tax=Paenibacillus swuensis TaxID=1178515 RepID=A0A172TGG5_9BACL|nr:ABC transporter permease [Paenibacillus swuensis]ANE46131.1 hypothetical protein SY83_07380 [Paenibacillus swuensis]
MNKLIEEVSELLSKRIRSYRKEILPYWSYVLRSGFPGFVILLLVVGSILYARTLEQLTPNFPVLTVILLLLVPALHISPIRTYLKEADTVFILPLEWKMSAYLRRCLLRSGVMQSVVITLVWIVAYPLYMKGAEIVPQPFWVICIFLLGIKWANLWSSSLEINMTEPRTRGFYWGLRWIITGMTVYVLIAYEDWLTKGFIVLVWVTFITALNFSKHYKVHWTALVEREKRHRAGHYMFFGWFTDVPEFPAQIRKRAWLTSWFGRTLFRHDNTYHFLYTRTLARTELFAMASKLTLVGMLAIFLFDGTWTRLFFYTVILLFVGIQLSSLDQHHRFVFWSHIYPLQEEYRVKALRNSILKMQWLSALILLCSLGVSGSSLAEIGVALAVGFTLPWMYAKKLEKKWAQDDFWEK